MLFFPVSLSIFHLKINVFIYGENDISPHLYFSDYKQKWTFLIAPGILLSSFVQCPLFRGGLFKECE